MRSCSEIYRQKKEHSKTIIEQTNRAGVSDQKNRTPATNDLIRRRRTARSLMKKDFAVAEKKGRLAATLQSPEGDNNAKRNSLDVFGSPKTPKTDQENKSESFGTKASMICWDMVNPRIDETGNHKNQNVKSDDHESDAISEFDKESFSIKTNSFLGTQTSDGSASCLTPTTCYAPRHPAYYFFHTNYFCNV
ncbi:hypothetical protein ACET3Z_025450 [Daucus carota]